MMKAIQDMPRTWTKRELQQAQKSFNVLSQPIFHDIATLLMFREIKYLRHPDGAIEDLSVLPEWAQKQVDVYRALLDDLHVSIFGREPIHLREYGEDTSQPETNLHTALRQIDFPDPGRATAPTK